MITVDRVTVREPAWVVIHAEREGQIGEVLGQTAVSPGVSSAVEITIDPLQATDTLSAMIHVNVGSEETFDFPGKDNPLLENGATVSQSFAIERQMALPEIQASDQTILEDGLVRIDTVRAPGPGWVVIHAQEAGAIGPILGAGFVKAGLTEDVVIRIPWREGTPTLYAMLHEDDGREQRFDFPEDDLPVLAIGEPVVAEIQTTYPPNLVIFDQPVIDNRIVVERVISNGPGWVVVYAADEEGGPGIIIGSAALADGLNEQVSVGLLGAAVTEQLLSFCMRIRRQVTPSISRRPISKLCIRDALPIRLASAQTRATIWDHGIRRCRRWMGETAVTIPFTVTEVDAWAVIYTDDEGELGEIIGQTWLAPGVNRDVRVVIDPEQATDTLYAVLHWDAGTIQDFEPGGTDIPFQRNLSIISVPFSVISEP
ncbi:MAG: hypothetical protein M5U34_08765 [Chloroflexi bacterium]|nr:hypothetical protein [Chloroflexota bacterium]